MKTSIRNLRKLVREAVRQVLKESKCPHCGDPEAYEGLFNVKCPNKKCPAYDEQQAIVVGRSVQSDDDDESDDNENSRGKLVSSDPRNDPDFIDQLDTPTHKYFDKLVRKLSGQPNSPRFHPTHHQDDPPDNDQYYYDYYGWSTNDPGAGDDVYNLIENDKGEWLIGDERDGETVVFVDKDGNPKQIDLKLFKKLTKNMTTPDELYELVDDMTGRSDDDDLSDVEDYLNELANRINDRIQQDGIKGIDPGEQHQGFEVHRDEDDDGNEIIVFVDSDEASGIFQCPDDDDRFIYDILDEGWLTFDEFKDLTENVETPDELYDIKKHFRR